MLYDLYSTLHSVLLMPHKYTVACLNKKLSHMPLYLVYPVYSRTSNQQSKFCCKRNVSQYHTTPWSRVLPEKL